MRIPTLLQKLSELADHPERRGAIDVDLMLDYTRVLYADLLEWRSKLPATHQPDAPPKPAVQEPTLAELTDAVYEDQKAMESVVHTPEPAPGKAFSQMHSETQAAAPVIQPIAGNSKDVRALIGINDKYRLMSELFGNDKAAYEEALNHINRAKSEQAALQWLRERLWVAEEHSDAIQSLYEIVGRFFRL